MAEKRNPTDEIMTGLENAENVKEAEYDLVKSLLASAEYAENTITEVDIKRKGVYCFTVHFHPLSDEDVAFARKKATEYMPNPQNKKLPPVEKSFNTNLFNSWLIYLATTEEDQQKIWGNPSLMKARGLSLPVDGVNALLTFGEKRKLSDLVVELSGESDDEDEIITKEDYAKN